MHAHVVPLKEFPFSTPGALPTGLGNEGRVGQGACADVCILVPVFSINFLSLIFLEIICVARKNAEVPALCH